MHSFSQPELQEDNSADQVTQWALRAKEGDNAAFERLARHFWQEVFRMLYYRVSNQADAEDLCQEVFEKALKSMPSLRSPESVRSWLFGIALNQARDFHRKLRLKSIFQTTPEGGQPESADQNSVDALESAAQKRFWGKVHEFRESLPPLQREVFTLRYLDELSIPEIADALHKSQSAIKTHLYRAVERFKKSRSLVAELREEAR
jgi:RNA polymerase sigma-70 factor (ECF subfamily)